MEYYGWVLLKFLTGFVIVITHLNLSGKTQLSQMTPVDLIGNFVIGGIILVGLSIATQSRFISMSLSCLWGCH